jgi:hypothetical protein
MNKGELLGKGMTAEVYAWGQDRVLKLYLENYREEWIRREADIGQRIHDAGVPSPAVYEMVEVDGRKGVIFQRIYGKTAVGLLASRPYLFCDYVFQMAGFHYKIHQYSADGIPSQKERLSSLIRLSSDLLGSYKVKRILSYLDRLPVGELVVDEESDGAGFAHLTGIADRLQQGPVVIQGLVLLRVITGTDAGAEGDLAGIRAFFS